MKAGDNRIAALGELSRLYHANGFFAEACQCYQALLQADGADPLWPYRFATIVAGYGQLADALPLLRRAVSLAPDYIPARIRLGDTLLKMNQKAEAGAAYAAVLDREPNNPYALLGLARLDVDAGRWAEARERLEVVVRESSSDRIRSSADRLRAPRRERPRGGDPRAQQGLRGVLRHGGSLDGRARLRLLRHVPDLGGGGDRRSRRRHARRRSGSWNARSRSRPTRPSSSSRWRACICGSATRPRRARISSAARCWRPTSRTAGRSSPISS